MGPKSFVVQDFSPNPVLWLLQSCPEQEPPREDEGFLDSETLSLVLQEKDRCRAHPWPLILNAHGIFPNNIMIMKTWLPIKGLWHLNQKIREYLPVVINPNEHGIMESRCDSIRSTLPETINSNWRTVILPLEWVPIVFNALLIVDGNLFIALFWRKTFIDHSSAETKIHEVYSGFEWNSSSTHSHGSLHHNWFQCC